MSIAQDLERRIADELGERQAVTGIELCARLDAGEARDALEGLLFFTSPRQFAVTWGSVRGWMSKHCQGGSPGGGPAGIQFATELAIALRSALPVWNLLRPAGHERQAVSPLQLQAAAAEALALAGQWAAKDRAAEIAALDDWRLQAQARFRAEGVQDSAVAEGLARELVGDACAHYADRMAGAIQASNLRRILEMRVRGETATEIGNDYAALLDYALLLGASFVTTNPPLVDLAWSMDPQRWNPVVDGVIGSHPEADDDGLARLVTLEVVLSNMRLLRPIFLLSRGKMGYVSLQVNPKKHGDAQSMISDALTIYSDLETRLSGGVPNVVFKLPATFAGLLACRELTGRGIGVNITVNFGLFQELRFAEAMRQSGQALVSYLTSMNGRLAFPVRDELLARLPELAKAELDEAQAREGAAWAGVAVTKRLHRLLSRQGYDLTRVRPLVASLRWYQGPGYGGLPSAFPDITEVSGVSVITVFPNIRRPFDAAGDIALDGRAIEREVPVSALRVLAHSEIFRQAYRVGDAAWGEEDDPRLRPDRTLALEDEAGTAAWKPVHDTLAEFGQAYDRFVERIRARRASGRS